MPSKQVEDVYNAMSPEERKNWGRGSVTSRTTNAETLTKAEKLARALDNVMSGGRAIDLRLVAQCRDELRRLDRATSKED